MSAELPITITMIDGGILVTDYFINEDGEVFRKGRKIAVTPNTGGYLQVRMWANKRKYSKVIHRLVALYFIPNPENKPQVNHIDGIKSHNYKDNLEWVTPSENVGHAFKLGLRKTTEEQLAFVHAGYKKNKDKIIEDLRERTKGNQRHALLNETQVREIKVLGKKRYRGQLKVLAEKYNVHSTTICDVLRNKTWKHLK